MRALRSFCIAFSTYSKIPMPQFAWKEEDMRYTLVFFPWVGAVIAGIEVLWIWLCRLGQVNPLTTALVLAALPLLVTGGFHLDGFMDTMDAIHSYQSRERKLRILKDSHVGAFAVLMLLLYYLLYVAACYEVVLTLSGMAKTGHWLAEMTVIGCACILSRVMSGLSLVFWKSAKEEGSLYVVAKAAQKQRIRFALIMEGLVTVGFMVVLDWRLALVVSVGVLGSFAYYGRCSRVHFGGITGDVAGYFVTVCECVVMILSAIWLHIG